MHYTLLYSTDIKGIHCTRTYNENFRNTLHSDVQCGLKNIILGRIIWFLILYCTRTYSTTFILHSDVQYDFYTALGRTVRFLYCTRMHSTIFNFVLHSDIQYDFDLILYYTRTYSTILYCTRTYSTIFDFALYSDV